MYFNTFFTYEKITYSLRHNVSTVCKTDSYQIILALCFAVLLFSLIQNEVFHKIGS